MNWFAPTNVYQLKKGNTEYRINKIACCFNKNITSKMA